MACSFDKKHGVVRSAEQVFGDVEAYVSLCREGDVRWDRWTFEPSLLVLNHDDGYQVDFFPFARTSEILPSVTAHVARKRLRFDASDVGHLMYALEELFGDADDEDPVRVLNAREILYPLPEPIAISALHGVSGVYCVRAGDYVKIGQALDVAKRLRELQTGSAHPLEVLSILSPSTADERAWHRRFEHLRVRGEWFQFCEQIAVVVRRS
jgi:hypothetical protein